MIKKQGITVTAMVITIIILMILAGTISFSAYSTLNYSRISVWANEMMYIQDMVEEALNISSAVDFTKNDIAINVNQLAEVREQFEGETIVEDDTIVLKTLDLGKLKATNTTYGNLQTDTDVYAISIETGRLYYVQGIEIDGKTYYCLTDSLKNKFELRPAANELASVIFVPSVIGYTNEPISAIVKLPNTYTDIVVTTSNSEIEIGSQVLRETIYEYEINTNNIAGNYTITVSYNDGTQTLISKYEVNGYDITPPVIEPIAYENILYKETDTATLDYLTDIKATDDSGIKVMKYALGVISGEEVQEYFSKNTNIITNGRINLARSATVYTIYAEDNAGNFSIHTFDKKYLMPDDWKTNVTYIQDRVPIPKGFVASPYNGEDTKNGGLVIYELTPEEIDDGVTELPTEDTHYKSLTTRNQYVWVPVANRFKTEFIRQSFAYADRTTNISNELGLNKG